MSETPIMQRSLGDCKTGRTDWSKLDQVSDEDIKSQIASNQESAPELTEDWLAKADLVIPAKRAISIRLDEDILDFFQKSGGRYQTKINQVLRAYMDSRMPK